jgi:hypothetical protein
MLGLSGGGTGNAQTYGSNSNLSADVDFVLVDHASQPPTHAVVSSCVSELSILDLTFERKDDGGLGGTIVTNIINGLEGVLRTTIEGELNGIVCNKMGRLDDALDDMLVVVLSMIDNVFFLGGGGDDVQQDPLSADEDATVPINDDGLPMWIDFIELQDVVRSLTGLELMDKLSQQFMGDDVSVIVDFCLVDK